MNGPAILLPVKVNDEYANLVRSGINLARFLKGKISFLYVVEVPEYTGYPAGNVAASNMGVLKKQKEEMYEHYLKVLEEFKSEISGDIPVEFISVEGTWGTGIIKATEEIKPYLLMLEHDEKMLIEKILGETNTEIVYSVDCPVWIVPKEEPLSKPSGISFVTNHTEGDLEVLKELIELNKRIDAQMHLLHIVGDNEFESSLKVEGFKAIIDKELGKITLNHLKLKEDNMKDEIGNVVEEHGIDLLVVHNESEGFMNRFFTRSSVEKLTDSVDIPFVIY